MNRASAEVRQKEERQREIVDILQSELVDTQETLARVMRKRGYRATQTTLSRDLSDLKVAKVGGTYRSLSGGNVGSLERAFVEHAMGITSVGDHLLVLKTRSGSAQTVAIELDRAEWKEIVGTLAGDDTILIIVKGKKNNSATFRRMTRLIPKSDYSSSSSV